jgi:hypothetical protein
MQEQSGNGMVYKSEIADGTYDLVLFLLVCELLIPGTVSILCSLGGARLHLLPTRHFYPPLASEVMRISDSFVKVKVIANQGSVVEAEVIKFLGGARTPERIDLSGYSRLTLMSISSSDNELRLPLMRGQIYYLFIKKSEKANTYQLPTPTSGWAKLEGTDVAATYRHSLHKALVPEEVYEKTMQSIFNGARGQPYDSDFIQKFIKEQLTQSVAGLNKDPAILKKFFLQHVALETFYHLGKGADLALLMPFVGSDDYHVQVSACRAVSRIDSPSSREILMKFIEGKGVGFAKVMCVWGLKQLNAREMTPRLEAFLKAGVDQETGFGGDIMDPRVATYFPESVKESIKELLSDWRKAR